MAKGKTKKGSAAKGAKATTKPAKAKHAAKAAPKPVPKGAIAKKAPSAATAKSAKSGASDTAATQIATQILASLPPLSDEARAAFASQSTSGERADLGGRTKSDGVLRDAGQWLPQIADARAKFGDGAIRYGAPRLAYFAECVLALADGIATARSGRTGAAHVGVARGGALVAARASRDDLLHALGQIVRGSDDAGDVADVERDLKHDDQLAIALTKLASIAERWLDRADGGDAGAAALVAGANLTNADAQGARSAAAALTARAIDRANAGARRPIDPPEVNELEGAVLVEMRIAKHAFDQAHARRRSVPRLVPGPATRRVLGHHHAAPSAVQPIDPAAPAAPATNGAANTTAI